MRALVLGLLLALCGCGAVDLNAANCQPACAAGQRCCGEPTHQADGGSGTTAWSCMTPSNGLCPLLP